MLELLAVLLLARVQDPVPSSPPAEFAATVREEVRGAAGLGAAEAVRASALLRTRYASETEQLDAALETVLAPDGPEAAAARLFAVACRVQGGEVGIVDLEAWLGPVVRAARADPAAGREACELLAIAQRPVDGTPSPLGDALLDLVRAAPERELRRSAARALEAVGSPAQRRNLRDALVELVERPDAGARACAALALAEARIDAEVPAPAVSELRRLARLPTEDGRAARRALQRLEELRGLRDELHGYRELYRRRALPDDLAEIDVLMDLVQQVHLDGDKFTREDLKEMALSGMLEALDEHSGYLPADVYAEFYEEMVEPVYGGIGAYVLEDPVDGLITVARPIYSGPAYRAGLLTDDKIVRVDDWSTVGRTADDCVERLKGRPDTPVRVYVWRRGMDPLLIDRPTEDMAVDILRGQVTIPSVTSELLPGGIAMIELKDFNGEASNEVRRAYGQLQPQGVRGVVLDLRRNLGGLLDEGIAVADLFLPPGKLVVTVESREGTLERHETRHPAILPDDVPVVVLLSRYSASASEIVAGALQDHGRATIVGERSFGKGAVQTVLRVPNRRDDAFADENGNGLFDTWERIVVDHDGDGEFDFAPRAKVTYARYVLPSGRSIHRELDADWNVLTPGGVQPDEEVGAAIVENWRLQERYRLIVEYHPRRYVQERWDEHADLFRTLAVTDFRDTEVYPGFEEFLAELETVLPADDVRMLLRNEIRRRVQDERRSEFPPGDFQEDAQVQSAIRVALAALGETAEDLPEYRACFRPEDTGDTDRASASEAIARRHERSELEAARSLLLEARDGTGYVSRDLLDRVLDLLSVDEDEAE